MVTSMVFSLDGTLIASGSYDDTIRVWDTTMNRETFPPLRGHALPVLCVTFSPDASQIASGSEDTTVRLWNSRSGVQIFTPLRGHKDCIMSLAYSPDGTQVLSFCLQGIIRLWDTTSGTVTLHLATGEFGVVHLPRSSVAFSSDGRYIKVALSRSSESTLKRLGSIRIWDRSGTRMAKSRNYLDKCTLNDPIIITPEGWIVHVTSGTIISKLPHMVPVRRYAASNTSITFTTDGDHEASMFIMHFPPTILTATGTWDATVYEDGNWDNYMYASENEEDDEEQNSEAEEDF